MAIPAVVVGTLAAVIGPILESALLFVMRFVLAGVLVYALYRFVLSFGGVLLDWIFSKVGSLDLSEATLEFVGLSAWLAERLQLAQCVSLAVSFGVMAFLISCVKSIK